MNSFFKREISNPIRALTLERLAGQLDSYQNGYLAEFALTAEAMEQRDDMLKNVITKRKKAVTRHGWEILVEDCSDEARLQRDALDYFYRNLTCTHALRPNERGGFQLLIYQMMDAVGKGYAVHEILWKPIISRSSSSLLNSKFVIHNSEFATRSRETSNFAHRTSNLITASFRFVPLWYFEATTGPLRFLTAPGALHGQPMAERDWLVTTGDALMIACSRAFLFKHYPLQAWLDFSEKFGLPGVRAITSAARGTPEFAEMEDALQSFMKELSVVTNTSEAIDVIDLKGSGQPPFPELVERMDRVMASLWRGADLSTLSRDRGYGATLQEQESRILELDDARMLSEHLNSTLDRWVLEQLFGPSVTPLARVKILVTPQECTPHDLAIDQFLIAHGARLPLSQTLERYGRVQAKPDEPALSAAGATVPGRATVPRSFHENNGGTPHFSQENVSHGEQIRGGVGPRCAQRTSPLGEQLCGGTGSSNATSQSPKHAAPESAPNSKFIIHNSEFPQTGGATLLRSRDIAANSGFPTSNLAPRPSHLDQTSSFEPRTSHLPDRPTHATPSVPSENSAFEIRPVFAERTSHLGNQTTGGVGNPNSKLPSASSAYSVVESASAEIPFIPNALNPVRNFAAHSPIDQVSRSERPFPGNQLLADLGGQNRTSTPQFGNRTSPTGQQIRGGVGNAISHFAPRTSNLDQTSNFELRRSHLSNTFMKTKLHNSTTPQSSVPNPPNPVENDSSPSSLPSLPSVQIPTSPFPNDSFAATQSLDDFIQLSPLGLFPHTNGLQNVDRTSLETLVKNFKSFFGRLGRRFAGLPFYIGHPDVPGYENVYSDRKAYGWIMDLEVREDGLYGRTNWSAAGHELISNGHYKFLSPYWEAIRIGERNGRGVFSPTVLKSVGLTNQPNLPVLPLANTDNTESADSHTACLGTSISLTPTLNLNLNLTPNLPMSPDSNSEIQTDGGTKSLSPKSEVPSPSDHSSFDVRTSTLPASPSLPNQSGINPVEKNSPADSAVSASSANSALISESSAPPDQSKIEDRQSTIEACLASCQRDIALLQERLITTLLDNAIAGARILPIERPHWENALHQNFEETSAALANAAPKLNLTSRTESLPRVNTPLPPDQKQKRILTLVHDRMRSTNSTFHQAWLDIRTDHPNLFTS